MLVNGAFKVSATSDAGDVSETVPATIRDDRPDKGARPYEFGMNASYLVDVAACDGDEITLSSSGHYQTGNHPGFKDPLRVDGQLAGMPVISVVMPLSI